MRARSRLRAAVATVIVGVAGNVSCVDAALAQLPPPPKVLGCDLGPNVVATKTCLDKAVKRINDDLRSADVAREAAQQAAQAAQKAATAAQQAGQVAQQQLQKPWVAAVAQIDASQLTTCLAGKGINLNQTMAAAAQRPADFAQAKLVDLWQKTMGNTGLVASQLAVAVASGPAPTIEQAMDRADRMFAAVAAQDPATQCLWAMLQPHRAQARAVAAQIYPAVKRQYDSLIEAQVRPAVNRATVQMLSEMNRQLRAAAGSVPRTAGDAARASAAFSAGYVPETIRFKATTEAQRYLLEAGRYARVIAELNALSGGIESGNRAVTDAAIQRVERELATVSALGNQIVVDIAIRVIRDFGHQEIRERVPSLMDTHLFLTTDTLQTVVMNLVTGVVALWYQPPNAVSEIIAGYIVIALNATKPAVKQAAVMAAGAGYDTAINAVRKALSESRPPSAYIPAAGPLGEFLRDFPTEAELLAIVIPEIGRMRAVLESYHESVRLLSRTAASRAGPAR